MDNLSSTAAFGAYRRPVSPPSKFSLRLCALLLWLPWLFACDSPPEPPKQSSVSTTTAPQPEAVRLPGLPQITVEGFLPGVQEQIQEQLRAVQATPEDPEANGRLGMILHAYELEDPAAVLYARARLLRPDAFRWVYYHALVLADLGRRDEAIAALRRALELKPNEPAARQKLADLLLDTGELAESRALYEQLLAEDAARPAAHFGLGRLLVKQEDLSTAIDHLQKAIDLQGSFGSGHYALGLAYRQLGDAANAEKHLNLYKKHQDDYLQVNDSWFTDIVALEKSDNLYIKVGQKLAAEGRTEEAIAALQKALEFNPQGAIAHAGLVGLYARLDDFESAAKHYREGTAVDPDLFHLHLNYGLVLLRQNRFAEAAEIFERAVAINPQDARAHLNLGLALQRLGKMEEGAEHFQDALTHDPNYREAHFFLGQHLAEQGDFKAAIEHVKKSLEPVDVQTPWFMWTLARLYTNLDEVEIAKTTFQRAKALAEQSRNPRLAAAIDEDMQAYLRFLDTLDNTQEHPAE